LQPGIPFKTLRNPLKRILPMTSRPIKHAAVVGTGQMGPGIAYSLAAAGCTVALCGRNPESLNRGMHAVQKSAAVLLSEDIISKDQQTLILGRVSGGTDLNAVVRGCDLVIESIAEDLKLKQDLFLRIEKVCPPHAILASNTSGLPTTQLAAPLQRPERFAVTHFWNPPHLMPLVEVVKGEKTAPETLETLMALLRRAGKEPVAVLKDTPGQLGNRLFHALIREAIYIVQEGIASAEDVDTAIKNGLGRRFPVYGALEHQDIVGLDMVFAIQQYLCKALCNDTAPAELLRGKFASGHWGVKTGRGFYDWSRRDVASVIEKRDRFLVRLLKPDQK